MSKKQRDVMKLVLKKPKTSHGHRLSEWLVKSEGLDLAMAQKLHIAAKVNQMAHAVLIAERRRCARLCEVAVENAARFDTYSTYVAACGIKNVRDRIIKGTKP